jgi:hypothetical protein
MSLINIVSTSTAALAGRSDEKRVMDVTLRRLNRLTGLFGWWHR